MHLQTIRTSLGPRGCLITLDQNTHIKMTFIFYLNHRTRSIFTIVFGDCFAYSSHYADRRVSRYKKKSCQAP